MPSLLRLAFVALVMLVGSGLEARSQFITPVYVHDGYAVALAKARDTLAADAYLVYVGTFGDLNLSEFGIDLPITLNFYQDTVPQSGFTPARYPGQADAWGYVFNSPSLGRTMSLVALQVPFLGWQIYGVPVDLPLPAVLVDTLDLRLSGTRSDTALFRLRRNSTWVDYRAQYPQKQPNFVTLGAGLPDGIPTPPDFEIDGPIWSFTYQRSGDTAGMICLVAANSGATACRVVAPSAAPIETAGAADALRVLPNPASDRVRIAIDGVSGLRGDVTLELVDARGVHMADLTASLQANDLRGAELDVSALAPGVYFVRLLVNGVATVTPLNVSAR